MRDILTERHLGDAHEQLKNMSSLRSGVNTDAQIRNGAWSERMKESAKLVLLSAALLVGIS
jgi:hypothetical protein